MHPIEKFLNDPVMLRDIFFGRRTIYGELVVGAGKGAVQDESILNYFRNFPICAGKPGAA